MPLEVRYLGAVDEDVLPCPRGGFLLLDLQLHDIGRMLDDLGDVGDMTRAHLAQDALNNPDNASNYPVALYGLVGKRRIGDSK
jgi:hypothetical protein